MNYGKKKAAKRQKKITSKSTMQGKRIVVRLFKALLICIILAAVVGVAESIYSSFTKIHG